MRALAACASVCFFLVLLLLMAGVVIGRVSIKEITVQGNEYYTEEMLLSAASVKRGDPIYRVDREAVAQALLQSCPYVKTVELRVNVPGTLSVEVTERSVRWALACREENGEDRYVLLDEQLVALEYARQPYAGCVVICDGLALPEIGESLAEAAAREDRAAAAQAKMQKGENVVCYEYGKAADKLETYLAVLLTLYPDMRADDAPIVLDLSQTYDQTLLMRDGCLYLLGNGLHLEERISSARDAALRYKNRTSTDKSKNKLLVDAKSLSHVFVREENEKY
jgi:hypothetical protein